MFSITLLVVVIGLCLPINSPVVLFKAKFEKIDTVSKPMSRSLSNFVVTTSTKFVIIFQIKVYLYE